MSGLKFKVIDNTGENVPPAIAGAAVNLHGWLFSNSAAAVGEVDFYVPADPPAGSGETPALPTAGSTKVFTVQIAANSSKEFFVEKGITYKYGLFAVASASTITGGVIYS